MLGGEGGIVEEAQRDPARGEFLLGLVDVAGRQRRVTCDQIGGAKLAAVDHLARQQPPLDPPFVDIVEARGFLRRTQHQPRGLGEFLLAAEQLNLGEQIAGVAGELARHGFQQRAQVRTLAGGGDACLRERHVAGAKALGFAHAGGLVVGAVQHGVHACLVVAGSQQRAEQVERGVFGVLAHSVVAPGLADQALGIAAVAASDHHLGECQPALGRDRRFILEPGPDRGVVAAVVPQRGLDAATQEGLRRPARIGIEESAVALDRGAVVLAAQDQPFGKLARDRIGDRSLGLGGVRRLALAQQLDDACKRFLVRLRRRGCRGHGRRQHRLARDRRGMLAGCRNQRGRGHRPVRYGSRCDRSGRLGRGGLGCVGLGRGALGFRGLRSRCLVSFGLGRSGLGPIGLHRAGLGRRCLVSLGLVSLGLVSVSLGSAGLGSVGLGCTGGVSLGSAGFGCR
ncbi:hypothetical protein ABIF05_004423 [Bradyrhizobium elkanii]